MNFNLLFKYPLQEGFSMITSSSSYPGEIYTIFDISDFITSSKGLKEVRGRLDLELAQAGIKYFVEENNFIIPESKIYEFHSCFMAALKPYLEKLEKNCN